MKFRDISDEPRLHLIRIFHKDTTLAIMPILASEALLCENLKIQLICFWGTVTPCRKFINFFLKINDISNFCSSFSMGVYQNFFYVGKYILKHKWITNTIDSKMILHNYILGRVKLHWNFSIIPKDGSDIDRCPNRKWVSTMCNVEICEYQRHP